MKGNDERDACALEQGDALPDARQQREMLTRMHHFNGMRVECYDTGKKTQLFRPVLQCLISAGDPCGLHRIRRESAVSVSREYD